MEQRERLAAWMATAVLPHGGQLWIAAQLGRTPRSLQEWMRRAAPPREPGRPARTASERWRATLAVARAYKAEGEDAGWRVMQKILDLPRRLIEEALRARKRRWRRDERERVEARRTSIEVCYRDVLWCLDATHLGRTESVEVRAEVGTEAASRVTLVSKVNAGAGTAARLIEQLEVLRRERGLPLIVGLDNGPENVAAELQAYLALYEVVPLYSVPRTPQHNARAERRIGEIKGVSGLGKGCRLESVEVAQRGLDAAVERLDSRPRACLGWRTARQADSSAASWYGLVDRGSFYAAACSAINQAVLGAQTLAQRRKAERKAILETAASFGLVKITRGGVLLDLWKSEGVL